MPSAPPPARTPVPTPVPRRALLRSGAVLAVGVGAAATASCTDGGGRRPATASSPGSHEVLARTDGGAGVVDPASLRDALGLAAASLTATRALVQRSTAVVVSAADGPGLTEGIRTATRLGLPLLVTGSGGSADSAGLEAELARLGTRTVVRATTTSGASRAVPERFGAREVLDASASGSALPGLPRRPEGRGATVLVRRGATVPEALEPTLSAVGARRVTVSHPDPRVDEEARAALKEHADAAVLAVGAGVGDAARLAQRVRTARKAPELPGGGLLPFPGRLMVALYGHPGTAALGMLGEQSAEAAALRARSVADEYAALTETRVVPAFELIATVASGSKGRDGDYSSPTPVRRLLPWVQHAERAGAYVVLDLQPGRAHFLDQAKAYEELLRRPWVGLALDPEWRLLPDEKHLDQIGSVSVEEVNEVGAWLAGLVRDRDLPPKVLTLHQFRPSMVRGRERLDTSLDEIQWLVHADGQGGQGAKQDTWRALRRDLPENVWLGWKNFEHEDTPMLTPAQTLEQVRPTPQLVSYQ
ncbi:hypothetical protein [Oryzobacter terrae]|uniref:hypothetical protein n=1 Tax=Oryzobacter terrae TaxID=1620385 RepID=UPI00366CCFC3